MKHYNKNNTIIRSVEGASIIIIVIIIIVVVVVVVVVSIVINKYIMVIT